MRTKLWSEVKERVLVAGPAVNDRMTLRNSVLGLDCNSAVQKRYQGQAFVYLVTNCRVP